MSRFNYGDTRYSNNIGIQDHNLVTYRARVESRKDPLKIGRIRVRIPSRHGIPDVDDALKVKELPWARRENKGIGGYDTGSFLVPPVGSFVYVYFEGGDSESLVYRGNVDGTKSKNAHPMGTVSDEQDDSDIPAGSWDAPKGENEIPKDVFKDRDSLEPVRDVVHKSQKGSTILVDEEDEKESFSFIDRAGQILKFISPLTKDKNRTGDNSFQRGTKNSIDEDHFDYEEDLVESKALYVFKDLATQVFRSVAEYGKEKIELISRGKEKIRRSLLKLGGGQDNLGYTLISEDDDTGNRIFIKTDPNNDTLQELVVQSQNKEVVREEMSKNGVFYKVWNKPFKIEVEATEGGESEHGWTDEKDEEMV